MAHEQQMRICLKYDTLENWLQTEFIPDKGELLLVENESILETEDNSAAPLAVFQENNTTTYKS